MKKFLKTFNQTLKDQVSKDREVAIKEERFYEAALLQFAIIETGLRTYILYRMPQKGLNHHGFGEKFWNDNQTRVSELVSYAYLLDLGTDLVDRIRKYISGRNELVHSLFHFQDKKSLEQAAKKSVCEGIDIQIALIETVRNYKCYCGSRKKYKKCHGS